MCDTAWNRPVLRVGLAFALAAILVPAKAQPQTPSWKVDGGDVRVVCPLTIGGSFEAKTRAITGVLSTSAADPHALAGEIAVDLKTLDTGISLRNNHMQHRYLEIDKGPDYEKAVVSGLTLAEVDPFTFTGSARFTGTLLVHGQRKPIAGEAKIRRSGSAVQIEASFPVVLADFGIPKPQYLGVGVKNEVTVRVAFTAAADAPRAAGHPS